MGAAAKRSTPEEFDKLVRDEITRTRVWKAAGVKLNERMALTVKEIPRG